MKIVIATTTGFHLRRLASALSGAGEDVEYISYMPRFRTEAEGLSRAWTISLFYKLLPDSVLALKSGTQWQRSAVERLLAKTDQQVTKLLGPSDVFIGLSSMAVDSATRARSLGAVVVIDRGARHVLSQQKILQTDDHSTLTQQYIDRELASYEEADFIALPSTHAYQSFIEAGVPDEKLFVCPLGVDLTQFRPTPRPSGPLRLLFVGGWTYQKGVDLLVNAVDARPDWHLTHVGTTSGFDFPARHPRIHSLGHRNHSQLASDMAAHHMLVLPSRQDGFGMVLLEALASGLPVVGSHYTGAPDIKATISQPEWVETFEPGSSSGLLEAIDKLAERERRTPAEDVRNRLGAEDRAYYSWAGYGDRYLRFLRSVGGLREGT